MPDLATLVRVFLVGLLAYVGLKWHSVPSGQ
jgi:hypothetical protein